MKTISVWTVIFVAMLVCGAQPAAAQEPGVDAEDCKESKLLSRMPGCGIFECSRKEFDSATIIINKAGETKELEGEVENLKLACPATLSQLQIVRNAEAALKKAGYTILWSGRAEGSDRPHLAAQKGNQWIGIETDQFNELPTYIQTAVLVKAMAEQMSASAAAMAEAIATSGKLDVYGITFATGQATITPQSDQVLGDVLAVLYADQTLKLRIEGHTDNVGDKAANQKLSEARARAVVAWLTGKGVDATRLAAAGLGDAQPVADNKTDDGRARNRRVVLVKQ
jgi:OOP family OmpA-OmpF porin